MATKKTTSKSNKGLLFGALALGGFFLMSAAKAPKKEQTTTTIPPINMPTQPIVLPQPLPLNGSLVLKRGSRGAEVVQLQKLLGVYADGAFGAITENALFNKKGVRQISLNNFTNTANVSLNTSPIGKIAFTKGYNTPIYEVDNGFSRNEPSEFKRIDLPDTYIGKIIGYSADKTMYLFNLDKDIIYPKPIYGINTTKTNLK